MTTPLTLAQMIALGEAHILYTDRVDQLAHAAETLTAAIGAERAVATLTVQLLSDYGRHPEVIAAIAATALTRPAHPTDGR